MPLDGTQVHRMASVSHAPDLQRSLIMLCNEAGIDFDLVDLALDIVPSPGTAN